MPSLASSRWQSPAAALATDVARRAARVVLGDRERGEVAGRPGPLERDQHVGELVLDRLERADRHAELLALLRVLERDVEDRLRGADHLERERDRRLLDRARAAPAAADAPGSPSTRSRGDAHAVEARRARAGGCRRTRATGVTSTRGDAARRPRARRRRRSCPASRATTTSSSTASPSITKRFVAREHDVVAVGVAVAVDVGRDRTSRRASAIASVPGELAGRDRRRGSAPAARRCRARAPRARTA